MTSLLVHQTFSLHLVPSTPCPYPKQSKLVQKTADRPGCLRRRRSLAATATDKCGSSCYPRSLAFYPAAGCIMAAAKIYSHSPYVFRIGLISYNQEPSRRLRAALLKLLIISISSVDLVISSLFSLPLLPFSSRTNPFHRACRRFFEYGVFQLLGSVSLASTT